MSDRIRTRNSTCLRRFVPCSSLDRRCPDLPNVVTDPARSTVALICASEKSDPYMMAKGPGWPCNYRGLSLGWFGPYEVNWDYYPTWMGDDRIVILDSARALELDVIPGQPNPSVSGASRSDSFPRNARGQP